jgi:hypothetical protein
MEEATAVQKLEIEKPGTICEVPQRSKTLIRKAVIPKVKTDIGKAISCNTGFISVLTTPKTTAATMAVHKSLSTNPGTKYSTTSKASVLIASLTRSFIILFYRLFVKIQSVFDCLIPIWS